ncbi:MAG TPA: hypothetical protein DEA26_03460 [Oceanospirillales bacterium]|nr:hypothetical protein [Oceanospirillaceae bacterium]HBS41712.1 hypothetical protein [Oceanospirillales bacterium]|tara:strand:- start:1294 stop:1761 length:468 start_codon:yes stop_codon:yes gene_type:complete
MVNDQDTELGPISLELLKKAVDESNDGIVIAEQEGDDNILIYVNKAFERLTGFTAADILYQDCRFLQSGDTDQEGLQIIRDAIKAERSGRAVLRNYRKDGSMFWNELSVSPVFNEEDQLRYYIGIQKDVTEQVEALKRAEAVEKELRELKASLKQ